MNIGRIIKRLWYGPPLIKSAEEMAAGKAVVEGVAAASGETLISPLTATPCVAYKYKAVYLTPSRTQGVAERLLKEAEVYAPVFELKIEGGNVKVVPETPGEFDRAEHQKLQSGGFRGFKVDEVLIRPGQRIRVMGTLSREGEGEDGFVLHLRKIELVEETPLSPTERRERLKQKKKKQKKKRKG